MTAIYELLSAAMRDRFGGSVTKLSEACDVSVALGSRWVHEDERKRTIPAPASCEKIARGLDLDPDYVLELAGHRQPRADRPAATPAVTELRARLTRLENTLSKYPRPFWLAVIEASERMADGAKAFDVDTKSLQKATNKRRRSAAAGDATASNSGLTGTFAALAA